MSADNWGEEVPEEENWGEEEAPAADVCAHNGVACWGMAKDGVADGCTCTCSWYASQQSTRSLSTEHHSPLYSKSQVSCARCNWVDPNADPWAYLIDDAYLLDDDPAPPTANQLWEIGGREDTKFAADPKEYIMTILEHDMDEVKEGKHSYFRKTKPSLVHSVCGHPI